MVGTCGSSFTGVDAALRRVVRGKGEERILLVLLLRVEEDEIFLPLCVVGEGGTARAEAAVREAASWGQGSEGVPDTPPALVRPAMVAAISSAGGPIGASTGVVARVAAAAAGGGGAAASAAAAAGCFACGRPAFFLGAMAG